MHKVHGRPCGDRVVVKAPSGRAWNPKALLHAQAHVDRRKQATSALPHVPVLVALVGEYARVPTNMANYCRAGLRAAASPRVVKSSDGSDGEEDEDGAQAAPDGPDGKAHRKDKKKAKSVRISDDGEAFGGDDVRPARLARPVGGSDSARPNRDGSHESDPYDNGLPADADDGDYNQAYGATYSRQNYAGDESDHIYTASKPRAEQVAAKSSTSASTASSAPPLPPPAKKPLSSTIQNQNQNGNIATPPNVRGLSDGVRALGIGSKVDGGMNGHESLGGTVDGRGKQLVAAGDDEEDDWM